MAAILRYSLLILARRYDNREHTIGEGMHVNDGDATHIIFPLLRVGKLFTAAADMSWWIYAADAISWCYLFKILCNTLFHVDALLMIVSKNNTPITLPRGISTAYIASSMMSSTSAPIPFDMMCAWCEDERASASPWASLSNECHSWLFRQTGLPVSMFFTW